MTACQLGQPLELAACQPDQPRLASTWCIECDSVLVVCPAAHPAPTAPPLRSYCRRIMAPTFWGGEPELLVLSQMLRVPILVYVPSREAGK